MISIINRFKWCSFLYCFDNFETEYWSGSIIGVVPICRCYSCFVNFIPELKLPDTVRFTEDFDWASSRKLANFLMIQNMIMALFGLKFDSLMLINGLSLFFDDFFLHQTRC